MLHGRYTIFLYVTIPDNLSWHFNELNAEQFD